MQICYLIIFYQTYAYGFNVVLVKGNFNILFSSSFMTKLKCIADS